MKAQIDIVCGMELTAVEITFDLDGRNYYFCSEGCRAEFLRNTDDYVPARLPTEPVESGDDGDV